MIDLGQLNIPALVRDYMLANTPRYLYRHLRAEPSVETLASSSTPAELLSAVSAIENKQDRTAEDIAIAYAMLVALSFQDSMAVSEALTNWQARRLAWAKQIVSILTEPVISTTTATLVAPGARLVPVNEQDEAPITVQELQLL